MKKISLKRIVLIFIVVAAFIAFLSSFIKYEVAKHNHTIKVSGNIEGDEVRLSFRVGGQIEELLVDEGYVLKEGDIIARLKIDELIKIKEENAAALKLAEHQYTLDNLDYERAENLYKEGAVSAQERDVAKTKRDTDIANIDKLKASLELSITKLSWAELKSTLNGYVTLKSSLAGEVVQDGTPVFTVIDLNNLWVTAYVNERDLGKVKLGAKAYVETDTYPGKKYDGFVSFVSSQTEFTPKYIQTNEERVKYVYRIKVRVDNSSLDLKPGMPADAYITFENDNNQGN